MQEWIADVVRDPVAVLHDRSPSADKLVAAGERALPLVVEAQTGPWNSSAHPVDIVEALMYVAKRIRANARA